MRPAAVISMAAKKSTLIYSSFLSFYLNTARRGFVTEKSRIEEIPSDKRKNWYAAAVENVLSMWPPNTTETREPLHLRRLKLVKVAEAPSERVRIPYDASK